MEFSFIISWNCIIQQTDKSRINSSTSSSVVKKCYQSEHFFINLAFKIGLNKLINRTLPSILIIDESFSCVDKTFMTHLNILFND